MRPRRQWLGLLCGPSTSPLERMFALSNSFTDFYALPWGRLEREGYWIWGLIPFFVIGLVHGTAVHAFHARDHSIELALILVWPNIALTARRLHDLNVSGWWSALYLAPAAVVLAIGFLTGQWQVPTYAYYFCPIAQVTLGLLPGTPGPNKYGPEEA